MTLLRDIFATLQASAARIKVGPIKPIRMIDALRECTRLSVWPGLMPKNPFKDHAYRSKYRPHEGARQRTRAERQAARSFAKYGVRHD